MTNLSDLFVDFTRIDLDARGGYARVAQVKTRGQEGYPEYCAFKLMRHELPDPQIGLKRFAHEFRLLDEITKDSDCPSAVTKIYDSGFAPIELSHNLQNLPNHVILNPVPELNIISTGVELHKFLEIQLTLEKNEPGRWLPYLLVELAPYDDSLLRQVGHQSDDGSSDFDRLPLVSVISMALQVLKVIDFLHKKHRRAYIDWKPEHIYWNVQNQNLKLIDWNVTYQLNENPGEKQNIRDEIRLFCGAALYCGLALNDPDNLDKPIGPKPEVKSNLVPLTRRRYWTDGPNFYQREFTLDDRIKQIVQKGLDPNQGFDSSEELRQALLAYAKQELDFSKIEFSPRDQLVDQNLSTHDLIILADDAYFAADYDQAIRLYRQALERDPKNVRAKERVTLAEHNKKVAESILGFPRTALLHFRQARSYLSGGDFGLAIQSLISAIGVAKERGMNYPDAENLLYSLLSDKLERKLEIKKRDEFFESINKAFTTETADGTIKDVRDSVKGLLDAQLEIQKKGILKIFASQRRLRKALTSARVVLGSENLLYKFVKKQQNRINLIRYGSLIVLCMISGFISLPVLIPLPPVTPTVLSINTLTLTSTPTITLTISPTTTNTSTPTQTPTQAFTPTSASVLGYGRLISNFFPLETPNGKRVQYLMDGKLQTLMLNRKQMVVVLDSKSDGGGIWYKCKWEFNDLKGEGWILDESIEFVPPPTPTVSLTQVP